MLRPLQESFAPDEHPDLLVGLAAPDDAAVWRIDDSRLLVMTTDFFTPVVDDPFDYGAIAGANALSDVYAMGATPFMALNIACLPVDLPPDIVLEIFRGLADTVKEAGAVIAGGHTIQDEEPKVGLVALGFASPDRLLTKSEARPGDKLVLTKPIGTGLIATAIKSQAAEANHASQAVDWMKRLNREAAALAQDHGVRAATDITGFSLMGHGLEMARNSAVHLRFQLPAVPVLAGAEGYAQRGFIPGGSADNRSHYRPAVSFEKGISEAAETVLFDAQTSGGLLLSVDPAALLDLLGSAEERGHSAWVVGEVTEGEGASVDARGEPKGARIQGPSISYLAG